MQTIKFVQCPYCEHELFHSSAHGDAVPESMGKSPAFEKDENGAFIICRYCSKRVELEFVAASQGNPAQWSPSAFQPYK